MGTEPRQHASQADIARRLGISRGLVSHALNGRSNVAEGTRQLILKTAQEMGFRSNHAARRLAGRKHGVREPENLIAVVLPPAQAQLFQNGTIRDLPYFSEYLQGIESAADAFSIDIISTTIRSSGRLPRVLVDGEVDGVVLLSVVGHIEEQAEHVPVFKIVLGFESQTLPCILPDEQKGVLSMVEHLLRLGHRSIGYIGHPMNHNANARCRLVSYRQGLVAAGIEPRDAWEDTTLVFQDTECARIAAIGLLKRSPELTALVCYNDMHAMGVINGLRDCNIAVPQRVSVTGFDDVSIFYGFTPSITSVAFDRKSMGSLAVQRVVASRLTPVGRKALPSRTGLRTLIQTSVSVRNSTAPAPLNV